MKASVWSLAAALAAPALAVPNQNVWREHGQKPGFMPKAYSQGGWQGWGKGWSHFDGASAVPWPNTAPSSSNVAAAAIVSTESTFSDAASTWSAASTSSSATSSPWQPTANATVAAGTTIVTQSTIISSVLSTDTLTITACPSTVTDCPEEQKTTFTTSSTHEPSVVTSVVDITVTTTMDITVTAPPVITTVGESLDSTVYVEETFLTTTTDCSTGWAAISMSTASPVSTVSTLPVGSTTTRLIPTMSSMSSYVSYSSASASSIVSSAPTSASPSSASSQASSWTPSGASTWSSTPSATSGPRVSPGFDSACVRVPIPGCTPCEGQPGTDPDTFCGLTIETDYYQTWPQTCMKSICKLTVENVTLAPDGVDRMTLAVNGKLPGDVLEAYWGDVVEVQVTNNLRDNGTSIHFHGVRQLNTNEMDGVPSITQCPIPGNGAQMTYTFVATQYGHTWYHSHYSIQAWDGVYGPMTIFGPSTWEYDYDLGPLMLSDWLHTPVFAQFEYVERTGSPNQDNVLINGVGVYQNSTNETLTGERAQIYLEPGKKHRLQLVCTALDSSFAFSIDNHIITVIGTDFVPIHPYTTEVLKIGIGQRYDVIIEANQPVGDYWVRVDPLDFSVAPGQAPSCGATNTMSNNTMAVVHYAGSSNGTPTTTAYEHDTICEDEPYESIVPWLAMNVGVVEETVQEELVITQNTTTQIYRWYLSGTTFQVAYDNPTLLSIYENNTDYVGPLAIEVPNANEWVYIIIETPVALSHPIHLHGHDFYVLAQGNGSYTNQTLNIANPPRRDVATLPIGGHLAIAFLADNPGAWLMHCHIGWHVSMGFAMQILEQVPAAYKDITDVSLTETCDAYKTYAAGPANVVEIDSGV